MFQRENCTTWEKYWVVWGSQQRENWSEIKGIEIVHVALSDEQRAVTMLADNDTHSYGPGSNGSYNFFFEDPRFISILKHRGSNHTNNIGDVIKVLEDWRSRYNISVVKECEKSEYCSGEFRDLILAYNSIHGYVSLLVSVLQIFLHFPGI